MAIQTSGLMGLLPAGEKAVSPAGYVERTEEWHMIFVAAGRAMDLPDILRAMPIFADMDIHGAIYAGFDGDYTTTRVSTPDRERMTKLEGDVKETGWRVLVSPEGFCYIVVPRVSPKAGW